MSRERSRDPLSKSSLASKRKSEKGKPQPDQATNSSPRDRSDRLVHKPEYNFSDDGSEDERSADYETAASTLEQSLQWQGKRLKLKDFKIELVRLSGDEGEKLAEPSINTSFASCVSNLSCQPREYPTRHRTKSEKSRYHAYQVTDPITEFCDENMIDGQGLNEYDSVSSTSFIKETRGQCNKPEENLSVEDNILKAVQNQNGRKIMSEDDEAFFWDWILKKD